MGNEEGIWVGRLGTPLFHPSLPQRQYTAIQLMLHLLFYSCCSFAINCIIQSQGQEKLQYTGMTSWTWKHKEFCTMQHIDVPTEIFPIFAHSQKINSPKCLNTENLHAV